MLNKYLIKEELERAISKMALLSDKENFKNLSERIAFIKFLSKMLRPVSCLLEQHKNNVCSSIVDNSGIDYSAMKGAFMKCLNDFENVADHGYLRSYDQDELVDNEYCHDYTTQELFLRDERNFQENSFYRNASMETVHKGVLDNSVHLYQRVKKELQGIIRMLDEMKPDGFRIPLKQDNLKKIANGVFSNPFDKWKYDSIYNLTRKPYDEMVDVARRFKEILEENGF